MGVEEEELEAATQQCLDYLSDQERWSVSLEQKTTRSITVRLSVSNLPQQLCQMYNTGGDDLEFEIQLPQGLLRAEDPPNVAINVKAAGGQRLISSLM